MEQTINEWFNLLEEPVKSKALEAIIDDRRCRVVNSMSDAIDKGFTWCESSQGHEFWSDIFREYEKIERAEVDQAYSERAKALANEIEKIEREKVAYSTSMREMLDKIADDSKVASYIRRDKYTINSFCNYLTTRNGMLSYLPNGREHKTNPDNGKWLRDGRQEMKPSKLARKIIREEFMAELTDADFEKFANKVRSYLGVVGDEDGEGKNMKIEITEGSSIRDAYHHNNYSRLLGDSTNLHGSCMRSGDAQSYFGIYEENTEVVKLIVARDEEGKVLGRALLWNFDDGEKGMDTIYGPDVIMELLKDWAIDNGYWYKSSQSCHHHQFDKFNGESINLRDVDKHYRKVTIKNSEFDHYPYLDSLYHLCLGSDGKYYLSNEYVTAEIEKTLRHTNGRFEEYDEDDDDDDEYVTLENGDRCHTDDATYLDYRSFNGDRVEGYYHESEIVYTECGNYHLISHCTRINRCWYALDDDAIVYVEDRDEWFLEEDTTYCEQRELSIHIDDATEVEGGWCDSDYAHECPVDGLMYHEGNMEQVDGVWVSLDNKESYLEKLKENENETERETTIA